MEPKPLAPYLLPRLNDQMTPLTDRLQRQLDFIIEADRLKHVFRRSYLSDQSRRENDAEHSWHLCLMVLVLCEHSNFESLDLLKTLKMIVLHDIVEIDAGDTYVYDETARATQEHRESEAAARLFGMLPQDQANQFHELWREFEEGVTKEAVFAKSIDRLHPMMLNTLAKGKAWSENAVTEKQVRATNYSIKEGSEALWDYADNLIKHSVAQGWLPGL